MVYSNSYSSCSFESEILKIGQSCHKMYSNNIVNLQESTAILNACTKKSGNFLKAPRKTEEINLGFIINGKSIIEVILVGVLWHINPCRLLNAKICLYVYICECVYVLWRGMLSREGKGDQFPYPSVFELTGPKDWPLKERCERRSIPSSLLK